MLEHFIRKLRLSDAVNRDVYPFNMPCLKDFESIDFHEKVTFFVGENGSGKSTFLEGLAVAYGLNPEGGSQHLNFTTHASHSQLSDHLILTKGYRQPRTKYFLRAESFYNVATAIDQADATSQGLGAPIIDSYGGKSLHKQSHGESFMALAMNRFTGGGLYILDEPEAALSPNRQLALLQRIHELVEEGSQFIIASHSPIILAYDQAVIYNTDHFMDKIDYEDTQHYLVTKNFLRDRQGVMTDLFQETT